MKNNSDTGNRTPGYRVRGDNVSHYTISDYLVQFDVRYIRSEDLLQQTESCVKTRSTQLVFLHTRRVCSPPIHGLSHFTTYTNHIA